MRHSGYNVFSQSFASYQYAAFKTASRLYFFLNIALTFAPSGVKK
jgi:hypothetical protein